MTEQFRDGESEHRSLNPTEYRRRLLNKLDCLISVLEVAIGKITNSMQHETPSRERLGRIKTNLENTLAICRRAKATLESKMAEDKRDPKAREAEKRSGSKTTPGPISFRSYVELSSIDEFRKFKNLEAISPEDLRDVDLDELAKRLLGEL